MAALEIKQLCKTESGETTASAAVDSEVEQRTCITHLSDGTPKPLWPGAEQEIVSARNVQLVQQATLRVRLQESLVQLRALRDGETTDN